MAWALGIDIRLGNYFPHWSWLPLQFSLALGPFIYFYVLKITRPEYKFRPKDLLHFSPLLLQQGILVLEIRESMETGAATYDTPVFRQLNPVLQVLILISVITYLQLCRRQVRDFHWRLKTNLVERSPYQLRWLRRLLAGFGWLWLVWIPFTAVDLFYYNHHLGIHVYYSFYLFLAAILIWIAAAAFLRPDLGVVVPAPSLLKVLPPADLRQKGKWLRKAMEADLFYQDAELSLRSLAEKLELNPNELSRIINTAFGKSFNDFINEYRIREVIRKMQDPVYDRITLIGIAMDAGFNSKSTFNRTFRQMTGKSPAEYKSRLEKERPSYTLRPYSHSAAVISNHETTPMWYAEKLNRNYMFKNYFKTAWRNIMRGRGYSALNIFGLATGMAVALIIGLWVHNQYAYDKFLPGYQRLYQVERHFYGNGDTLTFGGTSLKLADALRNQIPGIAAVAETDGGGQHGLKVADKKLYIQGESVAGDFLTMFQYPLLGGNEKNVLSDPNSIVLTESTAMALFGSVNVINKIVRYDNKNDLKVTGILKDIPANSTLQFGFLVPFSYLEATDDFVKRARSAGFGMTDFTVYVQTKPGVTYTQVSAKIKDLEKSEEDNSMSMKTNVILDPVANWHLYDNYEGGKPVAGFIEYVHIFSVVGILVLLIACINFVNLTTARSEKRAKEVGVRKAIGSGKKELVVQFLVESALLTFIAFLFSVVLVQLALPSFNALTGDALAIPFTSISFWIITLCCVLVTALAAGSRPAFYLSSFNPVKVLKNSINAGKAATLPRKILVVVQFSCSIALIISTLIIYQQVQYAKDRPSGYDKNRLVMTDMNEDLGRNYTAIRNEIKQKGIAEMITTASNNVTTGGNHRDVDAWPGKKPGESVNMGYVHVTEDYFSTVGMTMKDGRNFIGNSDTLNVIINEAAVKLLRLNNPINQVITNSDTRYKIIGVIKDAITASPFASADPAIFLYEAKPQYVMMYRLSAGIKTQDAITKLAAIFNKYNPAYPFTYTFADDSYAAKFRQEVLIGTLAGLFAAFAIFISCLGLFGLAAYMAEQRTKEIGIRKVLGASVPQVWLLLSTDFILLVVISCFIASPVAFYFLTGWLQKYDYRISISPFVFILAGIAAIIITIITISFQSIKAAIANPVKSLRSE